MLIEVDLPKRIFHAPDGYRRLTINLPKDLHIKLKIFAAEKECTVTSLIEKLLWKAL